MTLQDSQQESTITGLTNTITGSLDASGARPKIPRQGQQHVEGYGTSGSSLLPYNSQGIYQTDMLPHHRTGPCSEYRMFSPRGMYTPVLSSALYNNPFQHFYHMQNLNMYPFGAQFTGVDNMYEEGEGDSSQRSPFRYGTVQAVAKKLDPVHTLGNDWKKLADQLGVMMDDIESFEIVQGSPTVAVIKCAVKSRKLKSPNQLKLILKKMGRPDAAAAIPDEESNE